MSNWLSVKIKCDTPDSQKVAADINAYIRRQTYKNPNAPFFLGSSEFPFVWGRAKAYPDRNVTFIWANVNVGYSDPDVVDLIKWMLEKFEGVTGIHVELRDDGSCVLRHSSWRAKTPDHLFTRWLDPQYYPPLPANEDTLPNDDLLKPMEEHGFKSWLSFDEITKMTGKR